ncbi:MAG TPA: biotin/lipoyl-containing protein [Polyangiaceae bacterium]|jgi:biotin carboxyl carrier protein|nr:biotin/lipoyl-containing protein [Polyangiaceae bacterium]
MRYFVTIDGKEHVIDVSELPGGTFDVRVADSEDSTLRRSAAPLEVEASSSGGPLTVRVGGRVYDLVLDATPPGLSVYASGRRAAIAVENANQRAASRVRAGTKASTTGLIVSPMPGKVVKVLVKEGEEVEPGKPLVVVEAMKMENELVAEIAGSVQKVYVQPGDAVEGGARLVSIV